MVTTTGGSLILQLLQLPQLPAFTHEQHDGPAHEDERQCLEQHREHLQRPQGARDVGGLVVLLGERLLVPFREGVVDRVVA